MGECVPALVESIWLIITNGREGNVHFNKSTTLMTTATPSFWDQKVGNKCRQGEQTVFSLTVSCSSSRCAPRGGGGRGVVRRLTSRRHHWAAKRTDSRKVAEREYPTVLCFCVYVCVCVYVVRYVICGMSARSFSPSLLGRAHSLMTPLEHDTITWEMLHYGLLGFVSHKITQQTLCKENKYCVPASV